MVTYRQPVGILVSAGLFSLCTFMAKYESSITAKVVAMKQTAVLNRYDEFNPSGMLNALQRDVVFRGYSQIGDGKQLVDSNVVKAASHVRFHNLLMPLSKYTDPSYSTISPSNPPSSAARSGTPDERHNGPEPVSISIVNIY